MPDDIEQRFIAVESLLAHQAEEAKELSEVLSRQWQLLDDLARRLERVEDRLRALEGALEILPREAPPPHY